MVASTSLFAQRVKQPYTTCPSIIPVSGTGRCKALHDSYRMYGAMDRDVMERRNRSFRVRNDTTQAATAAIGG